MRERVWRQADDQGGELEKKRGRDQPQFIPTLVKTNVLPRRVYEELQRSLVQKKQFAQSIRASS